MKWSIKKIFNLSYIAFISVISIILLLLIKFNLINSNNAFSVTSLLIYLIVILFSIIITNLLLSFVINPLKKLEKNINSVTSGKIVELRNIKEDDKIKEVNSLVDSYKNMIEIVKKNNFDLNSEESKTEIILERMADGVVAFSVMKDVIHMNKAAKAMLMLDETYDTFDKIKKELGLAFDFSDVVYLSNDKCIEQKVDINNNIFNLVFVPFFNKDFSPQGVILMVKDITEFTRLDNTRKEFVSNVSHEFKTPLTSIKGYSEIMMRGDLNLDEVEKFAKVINQEATRMDRMVVDLLQLAKLDFIKASMKKVNFSLSDLAESVKQKMYFSAKQKEHTLICNNIKNTKIYADKDSIEQVLINVISNSIKYTTDGGTITLTIDNDGNRAIIKIKDNGIGIPKNELKLIFERFYRVDKARSRKMGGTGLGLSIVKEILDNNNGTIEMDSVLDEGTETTITLPLAR